MDSYRPYHKNIMNILSQQRPILIIYSGDDTEMTMIFYGEPPPELDHLDTCSQNCCKELSSYLTDVGSVIHCDNAFDLLTLQESGLLIINKGMFKFFCGQKLVRLYHSNDIILLLNHATSYNCRCVSEFGASITVIPTEALTNLGRTIPRITALLLELSALQSRIMHHICAAGTSEEVSPEFTIKSFEPGRRIITEGDSAHDIFMLVSGTATVTVKGTRVGTVKPGEVFGEISFFTSSTRSASVSAQTECMVQIMNKDNFLSLAKVKPSVNLAITKTLSQRLIATNNKVIDPKSS